MFVHVGQPPYTARSESEATLERLWDLLAFMSHRGHSNKHALPSNPTYIVFPRTDGDSALWPTNTTREIDAEGCVNFMQRVGLDEPLSVKWRVGVGDAISVALKMQGKLDSSWVICTF